VKTKGRENLLLNILNPNAEVAPQYMAFEVDTHDDESFTAVLGEESPTHVTLKMAGGLSRTISRKAVKGMRSNGRSLMPEGLQEGMSANQMADLLRFIETAN
jgi:putative heme-binding domain-containing protein